MNATRRIASAFLGLHVIAGFAFAQLPPDRITNPAGLQQFMDVAYNSEDDVYFLSYTGDGTQREASRARAFQLRR